MTTIRTIQRDDITEGNQELPVCPNCGQWQHPTGKGYSDCFYECVKLGLVTKPQPPKQDTAKQWTPERIQNCIDQTKALDAVSHSPLPRLTEAEAKENMAGAYITLADGRTQYCEHLSERERHAVNHVDKLADALRCALADLEGIMPEFDASGDRQHPGWTTIEESKQALAGYERSK